MGAGRELGHIKPAAQVDIRGLNTRHHAAHQNLDTGDVCGRHRQQPLPGPAQRLVGGIRTRNKVRRGQHRAFRCAGRAGCGNNQGDVVFDGLADSLRVAQQVSALRVVGGDRQEAAAAGECFFEPGDEGERVSRVHGRQFEQVRHGIQQ